MTIRRAVAGEASQILDLQKLAYLSEAQIYNDYSIPPLHQSPEEMDADFESHVFLVALENGTIVGSVRARLDEQSCLVGRLMVHPSFQNRGIGTRLMNEVERCFPEAGRFELFTGHNSKSNIHLYRKLGYRIFRREKVSENLTLLYMQKYKKARRPL